MEQQRPGNSDPDSEVRICINSSILTQLGQMRSPSASTQKVDVNGVVDCKNQWTHVKIMEV